jgi:hypothetical protein
MLDTLGNMDNTFVSPIPYTFDKSGTAYQLRKLFFVEANTFSQNEFEVSYKLNEEELPASNDNVVTISLKEVSYFVDKNEYVENGIIESFLRRLSAFFKEIEKTRNPYDRSNIVLPVEFTTILATILKPSEKTEQQVKDEVVDYFKSVLGGVTLNQSTILHLIVNLNNDHWNYVAVVFSSQTIFMCDSLVRLASEYVPFKTLVFDHLCKACSWTYELQNNCAMNGTTEWSIQRPDVLQQKETPPKTCGIYCMVFLLRGYLEGLYSSTPFHESTFDLAGKATETTLTWKGGKNKLMQKLKNSIAAVITGKETVLSVVRLFAKLDTANESSEVVFPCNKDWLPLDSYELFS